MVGIGETRGHECIIGEQGERELNFHCPQWEADRRGLKLVSQEVAIYSGYSEVNVPENQPRVKNDALGGKEREWAGGHSRFSEQVLQNHFSLPTMRMLW